MQTFDEYLKEKEKRNSAQRVKAYTPEEAESAKWAKWDEAVKQRRSEIRWEKIGGDSYDSDVSGVMGKISGGLDYAQSSALLPEVTKALERTTQMQEWANDFGTDEQRKTLNSNAQALRNFEEGTKALGQLRELSGYDIPSIQDYLDNSKAATEKKSSLFGLLGDYQYDYINDVEGTRTERKFYTDYSKMRDQQYAVLASHMTEDEKGIYNYLYAKAGKERADEYLASIEQTLNAREAGEIADVMGSNVLTRGLLAFASGVDSSLQGTKQFASTLLGNEEALPLSPTQIASSQVQSELGEVREKLYGAVQGVGQMLPAALLSTVTGGVAGAAGASAGLTQGLGTAASLTTFGTSAAGNAYQQAGSEGADPDDAKLYAVLVGASETGAQYLLGGIGKLGGKLGSKLSSTAGAKAASIFNGINNSILRNALKSGASLGGKMAAEGLEEGLQEFIEPVWAMALLDEDYEVDLEAAIDAFIIGGLTAGLMEGGGTVMSTISDDNFQQMNNYLGESKIDYYSGIDTLGDLNRAYAKLTNRKNSESVDEDIERQYAMRKAFFGGRETAAALKAGTEGATLVQQEVKKADPSLSEEEIKAAFAELDDSEVRARAMSGDSTERRLVQELASEKSGDAPTIGVRTAERAFADQMSERRDAINAFFKESGKAGDGFQVAQAMLEVQGIRDYNIPEAFRAYSLGENEAKATKKNAKSAENAESQTFVELDDSEVKARTAANAVVREGDGETAVEREVNVQAVERVEGGKVTVKLEDGSTVDAETVDFEDGEVGTLYRASSGLSADAANRMIASYERTSNVDAVDYANQFTTAYNFGRAGISTKELAADANLSGLTDAQKQVAYKLGREEALAERKASSERAKNARATGEKESGRARGRVRLEKGTEANSDIQRESVKALEKLAAAIGVDFHLYESRVVNGKRVYIDKDGKKIKANGWYDPSDGSIHLDVNAGAGGEGTILFTAAHELTHFIRDWSPEKFGVLADFLMEQYNEKGVPVSELIENQIQKAKKNNRTLSFDEAYEEVIADSMETMLTDGKVISELASRDRTLFEKIKDFIADLAKKVRALYKGMLPNSKEGRIVAEMSGALDRVQAMFADALVDASDNYARGQKNNANGQNNNAREGARYSFRDSKSGMANDALMPYDSELVQIIEQRGDYIVDSYEDLKKIVDLAFDDKSQKGTAYFGVVNSETLERMKDSIPNMPKDNNETLFKEGRAYSIAASLDSIRHIVDDKNLDRADVLDYLDRFADTILEYDSINFSYYEKGNNRIPGLLFKKSFSDGVLVSFDLISQKKRNIGLQSLYMDSVDYQKKKSAETLLMQKPQQTPKAQVGQTSIDSISQPDDSVKRKFSDRDYTDLETHFGTTRNYDVAGYLMTDGKMLDFSGSHWGDTSSDFRQVDHRDVYEVEAIESEFNNGREAMVAMIGDGNIRLNPESGGINLAVLPNAKQITALRGYINHFGGEVVVDVDDVGGDTIHSFEYNKGTSAAKIISDIKRYFEDGTIPEVQSEIGQFRYSDRDEEADFSSRGILKRVAEHDAIEEDSEKLLAKSPAEKQRLSEYQTMRAEYDELEAKRYEISDRLRMIRASDGKRNKAYWDEFNRLRNESIETRNRLANLERRLRSYEGSKTLSRLIERERRRQMEEYDRINREEARRGRDKFVERNAKADLKRKILSGFNFLNRRLENPTKTEHVPEALRKPVASWLKIFNMDYAEADERVENYNNLIAGTNAQIASYRSDIETLEPQERALQSQLADARVEATKAQQALTEAEAEYRNRRTPVLELDERRRALYRELDAESDEAKKKSIRTELRRTGKQLMDLKAKRSVASAARDKAKDALRAANRKVEKISGQLDKLEEARAELPVLKGKLDSFVKTRERLEEQGVRLNGVLSELQTAYEQILLEPDDDVAAEYNKDISDKIIGVKRSVGDTALRSMSVTQLEEVYELLCMIRGEVANKNKLFTEARTKSLEEAAKKVMSEVNALGREVRRTGKEKRDKALDTLAKWSWGNEKPTYAIDRIGSEQLMELQHDILMGQNVAAQDIEEGRLFCDKEKEKHGYKGWKLDEAHEFTAKNGKSFKITTAEIMSLYAYSKRPQAWDHLEIGGFTFKRSVEKTVTDAKGKKKTYYVEAHQTYNLSREQVAQISATLTSEQRAFVDSMQDYLSTVMGKKGNEVSMQLYGIKLFKEKFYFPLKTDKQYQVEMGKAAGERTLVSSGMTKNTVKGASNPIVLEGFMDVWGGHVEQMSTYHGLALPLENFHRVLSYKEKGSTDGKSGTSVKASITTAHGEAATKYLSQYLTDLNGGLKADPKEIAGGVLLGRFKKAAVLASASVVAQQPTSIVRACAEIHPKYIFVGEKLDKKKHAALWAEIKKYAGVAVVKEAGGYDTGTSGSMVDYIIGKDESVMDKVDNFLGRAPAYADEVTWCAIWKACLREQKALHPELSGEALKKAAGERFTVVVDRTQVYDSTVSKSQHMRSKNTYMNMITAFLGEPTTSINMREKALRHIQKGEWGKAARVTASVWGSALFAAVMSSLVYAARDDDEDETWAEKFLSSLTVESFDNLNPLTALPIVKDVWSLAQGYDVERSDMSLFAKFFDAGSKVVSVCGKDTEGMTDEELNEHYGEIASSLWGVVETGASLMGIPAKNVAREITSVVNVCTTGYKDLIADERDTTGGSLFDAVNDNFWESFPIVRNFYEHGKNEQLYEAIVAGDGEYVARMKSSYKDESAYKLAVRKALKENDPRIKQAAEARVKGDVTAKNKLLEEIVGEGHFSKDMVNQAINSAQNDITRDAAELLRTTDERIGQAAALKESDSEYQRIVNAIVREGEYSRETVVKAINTQKGEIEDEEKDEVYSIFDTSDVNAAYESGDEDLAHEIVDDLIATKVANGTEEEKARSSVRSSMTRYWKPIYKAAYEGGDSEECERIEDILADSDLYGRPKELRNTLKSWRKDDEEEEE